MYMNAMLLLQVLPYELPAYQANYHLSTLLHMPALECMDTTRVCYRQRTLARGLRQQCQRRQCMKLLQEPNSRKEFA